MLLADVASHIKTASRCLTSAALRTENIFDLSCYSRRIHSATSRKQRRYNAVARCAVRGARKVYDKRDSSQVSGPRAVARMAFCVRDGADRTAAHRACLAAGDRAVAGKLLQKQTAPSSGGWGRRSCLTGSIGGRDCRAVHDNFPRGCLFLNNMRLSRSRSVGAASRPAEYWRCVHKWTELVRAGKYSKSITAPSFGSYR